ncbi:hypothetical protein [Neorhizobium tomejilense]|uniref:hypothetical protein n=1 Tax=Neorhizobium tomejilense TaxID=2093828 RepID=UPI001FE141A5|nr:hypothetical protein [Neorhizobium tomejilense]
MKGEEQVRRHFPISLVGLVVTGCVFVLQAIPFTGIFLMFAMAMAWSVVLVNGSMIGVAIEAIMGRVSRLWLLLPLIFYGGYWTVAALEHSALRELTSRTDAANMQVMTGFDPAHHALVFERDENGNSAWLTNNFALSVAYTVKGNVPEGYLSKRMIERPLCVKLRETRELQSTNVQTSEFRDGEAFAYGPLETRFCNLSMPERPELPIVTVSRKETKGFEKSLPVTRTTTTITMPNGRSFQLLGGVAAPLGWIPMPLIGCGLDSGAARWECGAGFSRNSHTPIVPGGTPYRQASNVLARALGLVSIATEDRAGSDSVMVLAKIVRIQEAILARQLANVDAMIADPTAKVTEWQIDVLVSRADALASHGDAVMTGIERAARLHLKARESGRILARLAAALPPGEFAELKPRLLAVYASAGNDHWLWEVQPLLRRLGDLGPDALPYLINPRASLPSVDGAAIEGLCRVGSSARVVAEPVLLALWAKPNLSYDLLNDLFVAMRRMGISPPPLVDDKRNLFVKLQADGENVSPSSPSRVCAAREERIAREQERIGGVRRHNLY